MAFTDYMDQVQQLYIAYYGRPADPIGQEFWAKQIDAAGGRIEDVVNAFGTSAEAVGIYSALDTPTSVNNVYNNILGRDADIEGLKYYTNEINSGNLTLAQLAQAVIAGVKGDDVAVVANKLAAANLFTAEIDTAAEILQYSGDDAAADGRTFLSTVTSDEATVPTEADAAEAVAALPETGTGSGQTFTLTDGIDTPVGTNSNDTFIANNDTWNVGDTIDGGNGIDTLTIANENEDLTLAGRTLTSVENLTIINVDPDSGDQDFNFANKALDTVTIDFANTENLNYVYADNLRADTDLVVTNVIADGYYVYRNYDEVYSTLTGSVSQNNTFSNIDGSVNDDYLYFENYAYFATATELNLTETWDNVTNGGTTSTGSDDSYAYSYNYVDLQADSAVINVTYNLTDVVVPDGYSYLDLEVENGSLADETTDTVNVTYNLDNVDGLEAYVDTNDSGDDGETDTVTINANNVANSYDDNDFSLYYFETVNINVTGESDLGDLNVNSAAADQTINIVADANVMMDELDAADDYAVEINISGAGDVAFDMYGDNEGVTVNAADATGDLDLEVGSDATFATIATLGTGDDTLTLMNAFELNTDSDAFIQVLDGGEGTDTFEIDADDLVASQALLNADVTDFSDAILNFERLSLTDFDTQDIDATTLGFNYVTIDGYTTGASLTVEDAATVIVTGNGSTDAEIIVDDAATGTQSLNLTVNGADGIALNDLTVADVETINIASSASDPDDTTPGANTVDLIAADATTLNVSGETELVFGGTSVFTALETVDAAAFDAGLTIDVSTSGEDVTITTGAGADVVLGSDQDDTISVGDGGNTVTGNQGIDTITLGDGATADDVDTLVYLAVEDSQGVTVDVVNGFQVEVQATTDTNADDVVDADDIINDVLDFSSIAGLTGTAAYLGEANGYGAVLTALSGGSVNTEAVLDISTSTLYVDIDGSGTLDDSDMAIQLNGVTDLSGDNFAWV